MELEAWMACELEAGKAAFVEVGNEVGWCGPTEKAESEEGGA